MLIVVVITFGRMENKIETTIQGLGFRVAVVCDCCWRAGAAPVVLVISSRL